MEGKETALYNYIENLEEKVENFSKENRELKKQIKDLKFQISHSKNMNTSKKELIDILLTKNKELKNEVIDTSLLKNVYTLLKSEEDKNKKSEEDKNKKITEEILDLCIENKMDVFQLKFIIEIYIELYDDNETIMNYIKKIMNIREYRCKNDICIRNIVLQYINKIQNCDEDNENV
jgi:DNA repair ATPase RecN